MLLKRIEIDGFKSFANKTVIEVNKGITGIIGPNGSGKSNIADAVRWVLGEQNSRNLRGKKMEDVIFNGTENRNRRGFCSVKLLFDNEDGRFGTEYSEVSIGRKLYRGGDGEYTINERSARLKDIVELMKDTGIGKEGYSIIGQGRIDEILSSKPLARRKVFEEAAGIAKYRMRKEETEQKLLKTEENLVRINDILAELNNQYEPLMEQAKQAKLYAEHMDKIKTLDINVFLVNYDRFATSIERAKAELKDVENELQGIKAEFDGASEEIDGLHEKENQLENALNELNESITSARAEMERKKGDERLAEQKAEASEAEANRIIGQMEQRKNVIADMNVILGMANSEVIRLKELAEENSKAIEKAEQERYNLELEQGGRFSEANQAKQRQMELLRTVSEMKQELSRIESDEQNYSQRIQELEQRIKTADAEIERLNKELLAEKKRAEKLSEDAKAEISKLNEANSKRLGVEKKKEEIIAEIRRVESVMAQNSTRKKALIEMAEDYQGYSESVRNLMKRSATEQQGKRFELYGTLAKLIHVPAKYETALEAALGSAMQNVVVPTEEDAKFAIDFLRKNRLGRVTFLPTKALQVSRLRPNEKNAIVNGVVASEVIGCDEKIRPAVDFLLARTVIVNTLDEAIALMRKTNYSFRTVTIEGDIMRPGGVMTGGNIREKSYGLLSRERTIEQLTEQLKADAEKANKYQKALNDADVENNSIKEQIESVSAELQSIQLFKAQADERINGINGNIANAENNKNELMRTYNRITGGSEENADRKENLRLDIEESEEEREKVEAELLKYESENAVAQENMNRIMNELMRLNVEKAETAKGIETENQNAERTKANIESEKQASVKDGELLLEARKRADEAKAEKNAADAEYNIAEAKTKTLLNKSVALQNEREELKKKIGSISKKDLEYREKNTILVEQKLRCESQIERIENSRRMAAEKILEDYELTYASALEFKKEINYQQASSELSKLRSEVRAMGNINPNAVEEFERLSERRESMTGQKVDLEKAKEDLREIIEDLLKQMKEQFQLKFDEINTAFMEVYTELFGGGRAKISLEEGDIMECGIDIQAEPNGKKLQNIDLLSGGEKALTAIALIFAMLKVNPSPLCLLDEIDAPLDEANVARLAEYLGRENESQFLVITHRKPTMQACNVLYGTAMEERGITKLISVRVDA